MAMVLRKVVVIGTLILSNPTLAAFAQEPEADRRARETEVRMTDAERFSLLYSLMPTKFGTTTHEPRVPADIPNIAGYVQGVPRLGIPPLTEIDASLGVHWVGGTDNYATALPASIALGATFNPALANEMGAMIGNEVRSRGFNVALGGGINLIRDFHNGRNFEYISEDPLLTGLIGGEMVKGTQAQGVLATLKHISLNASETNKFTLDAIIDPAAHRESDLLAFEIAIEHGHPAALMCAYNKVNGPYACGSEPILQKTVRDAFDYKGWVMSDWLSVWNWDFILKGLDQQSGAQLDQKEWFNQPLREAVGQGKVTRERISEAVRRMLRSYYEVGIDRWANESIGDWRKNTDWDEHNVEALTVAREGIVLLKNNGTLPIAVSTRRVALIGGYANTGVASGDGSSIGMPRSGFAATIPMRQEAELGNTQLRLFGPSPLAELIKALPGATIVYNPGAFIAEAVDLAKHSDIVIVNAIRHEGERWDSPDMSLPFGQDALIDAVAAANTNTIVLLQTGNPIAMPWHSKVAAIVEAWYPGQAGAQAITEILTGKTNPSGKLPITFPADLSQTPHPTVAGQGLPLRTPFSVEYREGSDVGYRWFARTGAKPLYPFGYGLSYTSFTYSDLKITGSDTVTATFTVTNSGKQKGADVPQLYLTGAPEGKHTRLLGFQRVELEPGASQSISITADPRLLADYDSKASHWHIAAGTYRVALSRDAETEVQARNVPLTEHSFGK